jgi:pyruvate kinase
MKYRIIATLGPACNGTSQWEAMSRIPISEIRLNTSHIDLDQLSGWIKRLWEFKIAKSFPLSITLDLQGSKWRVGVFSPFQLSEGKMVRLELGPETKDPLTISVPHPDFFKAAQAANGVIALDDAKILLEILDVSPGKINARVTRGEWNLPKKGISLPESSYRVEQMGEKDRLIIEKTLRIPGIRYAISYIKDGEEMKNYRDWLGVESYLVAKIERKSAVDQAVEIADAADELWLCRGDLGSEMGLVGMAEAVVRYSNMLPRIVKPSILAGQVLEHMTKSPTPTRSEICYLYDAIQKGYQGFVLSDETAIGDFPIESCQAAAMFL